MTNKGLRQWFEEQVALDTDECINWLFTTTMGYGQLSINNQYHYVHRLACERRHGPCPEGMEARHLCGTPLCFNPRHLVWGTHQENMWDHHHKLTATDVIQIRRLLQDGVAPHQVATQFNINISHVYRIKAGKAWKHLLDR